MLSAAAFFGVRNGLTMEPMTFRVYVRWPNQRVTDKTVTDSRAVADIAFNELVARPDLARNGALGVSLTEDGKQLEYRDLQAVPVPVPSNRRRS